MLPRSREDPQSEETNRGPLEDKGGDWEAVELGWKSISHQFSQSLETTSWEPVLVKEYWSQLHWVLEFYRILKQKCPITFSMSYFDSPDNSALRYMSLLHPEQRACLRFSPCAKLSLIGIWLQNLTWNFKNQNLDFLFLGWLDGRMNIFRTQYIKLAPQKMNFTLVWIHLSILEPKFNPCP